MKRIHNRGVSFVELVIAVAIFAIMICPIVSKLIQTMNTANKSKAAQGRYEYAENLMENIKNAGSNFYDPDKVENDPALIEATKSGTMKVVKGNGTVGGKAYDGYIVTGQANVGRKNDNYYYAIHVNNQEYAKKESADANYKNPNNTTIPAIANFDSSDFAIINGTIGNYDLTVTNAFMSKKLDILRVGDKARWEQYTKQQADIVAFPNDSATRVIEIAIEEGTVTEDGVSKKAYTVTCKLRYKEKSTYILKDGVYAGKSLSNYLSPIEYMPYKQVFTDSLPNIYLMYNPCLYNNNYMDNDYILLNTDGLSSDVDVKLFVVETAEKYSEETIKGMLESYKEQYKEEHGTNPSQDQLDQVEASYRSAYLVNNDAIKERARVNVNIMSNAASLDHIEVYHNFDSTVGGNKTPIDSVNDPNKSIPAADASMVIGYSKVDVSKLLPMEESSVGMDALYSVDIYMSDKPFNITDYGDFVSALTEDTDTHRMTMYGNISPIISGSKGGNK